MKSWGERKRSTFNVQRSTFNVSAGKRPSALNVECWTLNVRQILLLFLLCLATPAPAADTSAFDQANKLYEEGKYREAAEAYSQLIEEGIQSPALFFNLGNAQFKAGRLGEAIVSYRHAEQLAPRDPDVRANLAFARRQVSGPTQHPHWLHQRIELLTTNEWTLIALVPLWLWFALLIARQLKPRLRSSLRGATWASGVASLWAVATLVFVLQHRLNEETVVVTARNAVVRYGPFTESQSAFTAADGAELSLLDRKDDWFQVSAGAKSIGWLKTNAVVVR